MTLLKTKVNIVFNRIDRSAREGSVFAGPIVKRSRRQSAPINAKSNDTPCPFAVAITPKTTTFREPSGRKPDAKGGPGRSAAWLAHLTGGQGVGGSNPPAPTTFCFRR